MKNVIKINKIFNFSNDIFPLEKYKFVYDEENKELLKFPKFFNQWRLIKNIEIGGWGYVFECKENNKSKKRYAIKIELKKTNGIPNEIINVYSKKSELIHIPKIYDTGIYKNYNYIVLEKLEKLKEEDLNAHTFANTITAIEELHSKKLSHGDIKIENIMKNNQGKIVLIDFGMTRNFGFKQNPNNYRWCYGTCKYMSLNAHNKIISKKNDLESLLYVIFFEILDDENNIWKSYYSFNSNSEDLSEKLKYYKERKEYLRQLFFNNNIKKITKILDSVPNPMCIFFMKYIKHLQNEKKISYDYLRNLILESDIFSSPNNK